MRIAILSLGLLAVVATVRAGEEKLTPKELPKVVRAAVKARFPEAKIAGAAREVEDDETVYEVTVKDDDQAMDVLLSAKGKILEVEKTIPARRLPKAVSAAIKARFPKAEIEKVEQVTKYDADEDEDEADNDDDVTTFFEVILSAEGKDDVEVKLSPKGKILEEDEGDEAKARAKKGKDDDEKGEKKVEGKKKDRD